MATLSEQEIFQSIQESIVPSCMTGLLPSRKALTVKQVMYLKSNGFKVQSIEGGTTGVITMQDPTKKGLVFIKLTPTARNRVEHWYPETAVTP